MFSLERVWTKFRQSIGKFGNSAYLFGLSSDKCSKNKNKIVVILKKLLKWRFNYENSGNLC